VDRIEAFVIGLTNVNWTTNLASAGLIAGQFQQDLDNIRTQAVPGQRNRLRKPFTIIKS
jgi:hypothetical protein